MKTQTEAIATKPPALKIFAAFILLTLFITGKNSHAAILTGPITNAANSHVYFLLASANWTDSEAQARDLGGHLATVRNQTEENWGDSTFSHWNGTNRNLWIGLYDPDPSTNSANQSLRRTEFKWISGEPVAYGNWSPYEPNSPFSSDTTFPELYVHIWNPTDPYAAYWNNYTNYSFEFSIELDGVAEIIPPAGRLQIALDNQPPGVDVFWKTGVGKTYELLTTPDLRVSTPTNLVLVVGADGTTNYIPATLTLLNHGWTNYGITFVGDGTTNAIIENAVLPKKFYQLISYP
jgi:Lectin C-type domain